MPGDDSALPPRALTGQAVVCDRPRPRCSLAQHAEPVREALIALVTFEFVLEFVQHALHFATLPGQLRPFARHLNFHLAHLAGHRLFIVLELAQVVIELLPLLLELVPIPLELFAHGHQLFFVGRGRFGGRPGLELADL